MRTSPSWPGHCDPTEPRSSSRPTRRPTSRIPFHVYLFERAQLVSLLSLFFDEVTCLGLEGDDALHADFAARRASGERLLRLDVLQLRRRMPRSAYVWAYERVLPVVYRMLGNDRTGIGSGLSERDFFATEVIDERTPGLFAIARRPRVRSRVEVRA